MNENDYLLAWSAYGAAALGCLLVWWQMTGWLWRRLREPLRVLVATLLATPTVIDPSRELFAPAIAVFSLDTLFKVGTSNLRALADLVMFGIIAFALYGVFVVIRWLVLRAWRTRHPQAEADEDQRTLRQRMNDEDEPSFAAQGGRLEPRL